MFSVQQFRDNIYPLFKLLLNTGNSFDIVYKGKVYELLLIPTNRKPHLRRSNARKSKKVALQQLTTDDCSRCGSLMINGICMNSKCPSNL